MRVLLALVVGLAVAAGCGVGAPAELTFSGVVVDVQGAGLAAVDRFTVRADGGESLTFEVERLDISRGKPAVHLREHLATGESVTVVYVVENGRNLALSYDH